MTRRSLSSCLLLFGVAAGMALPGFAAGGNPPQTSHTSDGPGSEEATAVAVGASGRMISVGWTDSSGFGGRDGWIRSESSSGTPDWERVVGTAGDETLWNLVALADGTTIGVGETSAGAFGNGDLWLVAFFPDGALRWSLSLGGTAYDAGYGICEVADGLLATGVVTDGSGLVAPFAVHFQEDGTVDWQRAYPAPVATWSFAAAPAPAGGALLVGARYADVFSPGDGFWIRIDADGDILWQGGFGGPGDDALYAASWNGSLWRVVGATAGPGAPRDGWIVEMDGSGAVQADRVFGGGADEGFYAIATAPGGSQALAGLTRAAGAGGADAWLLGLDGTGAVAWSEGVGGRGEDWAWNIAARDNNGWQLAGLLEGNAGSAAWRAGFSTSGQTDTTCRFETWPCAAPETAGAHPSAAPGCAAQAWSQLPAPWSVSSQASLLSSSPACDGCAEEEGDTRDRCSLGGTFLQVDAPATLNFCGDLSDWASFSACEGVTYEIDTFNPGPGADTFLTLYAPDCETLIAADDDGGGGTNSRIVFTATTSGIHHVQVDNLINTTGPSTNYQMILSGPDWPCDAFQQTSPVAADPLQVCGVPDGGVLVNGTLPDTGGGFSARFDGHGHAKWQMEWPVSGRTVRAGACAMSPGGRYLVNGCAPDPGDPYDRGAWLARLSEAGDVEWVRPLPRGTGCDALVADPVTGGWAGGGDEGGFLLARLDGNGAAKWVGRYPAEPGAMVTRLAARGAGLLAGGTGKPAPGSPDAAWIAALDSGGHALWQRFLGDARDWTLDAFVALDDGGVAATLRGATAVCALRLDADGNLLWQWETSFTASKLQMNRTESGAIGLLLQDGKDVWAQFFDGDGIPYEEILRLDQDKDDEAGAWWLGPDGHAWLAGRSTSLGGPDNPLWLTSFTPAWLSGLDCLPGAEPSPAWSASTLLMSGGMESVITLSIPPGHSALPVGLLAPLATTRACGLETPREVSADGYAPFRVLGNGGLRWDTDSTHHGAAAYNVYRGNLDTLADSASGTCFAPQQFFFTQDTDTPAADQGFFYRVTGINAVGEGPVGFSSAGAPVVNTDPCPPPGP